MDTHIKFLIIVSINFSTTNLIQKQKIKTAKNSNDIAICRQCIFSFQKALITQIKRINYHYINFIPFKVSNYSSLKDVTPLTLNANVDRQKIHFAMKVQEHHSMNLKKSATNEHISSCKDCHSCSISNFYTLAQANRF